MSQRSALLDALLRSLSRRLLLGLLAMLAIAIGLLGWPLLQHVEHTDREQRTTHARQAVAHAATWLAWRRSEQWSSRPAGSTDAMVPPAWLNEALNSTNSGFPGHESLDRAVSLLVTDATGRVLGRSDPGDTIGHAQDHPALKAAWADWQRQRQPLEPWLNSDDEWLISHAGVPGSPWVVWRVQPQAVATASRTVGRLAWTALGLLLVGGGVLAAALPRWLRPIARHLHRAMGERARATASRQRLLNTLDAWLRISPQGVALQRGECLDRVSGSLERMLKLPRQRLQSMRPVALLASEADGLTLQTRAQRAFEEGQPYQGEWRLRRSDGSLFWARIQGLRVDPAQPSSGILWLFEDVQSDVEDREQRAWSSNHDALTGLSNQAALQRKAERLVAQRQPPAVAALVHIDLPDVPALETLLGTPAVDGLIKQAGLALQARVRSTDTVARVADSSFAVLLPGCPPDVAARLSQEMRATLAALPLPAGAPGDFCEPCVGLASLTSGTGSAAHWLAQAAEHARALADPSPTRDDYITRMDDLITGTGSLEEAG